MLDTAQDESASVQGRGTVSELSKVSEFRFQSVLLFAMPLISVTYAFFLRYTVNVFRSCGLYIPHFGSQSCYLVLFSLASLQAFSEPAWH